MAETDIAKARALLTVAETPRGGAWGALGAAALAATAAVLMAGVMVLGPGVHFDEPTASAALAPAP